ncbi:tRNA (5-methylaminomethyl-2-thiouridine)(34)-methyltransferase MnmD [Pararhizobium gei]|uniref:tRNA (5-methylaminomethyl-2-thiouridine)(34)-methyltransferase MnmD n=1 Tax=Pararhizobium gei TaxID=1395951 RepID=UPI0023DA0861|nr:tRNA (5-methylaminomethyl-2-thiouridine)(34)-methyltransferase MnmD [Rhizobium gei]
MTRETPENEPAPDRQTLEWRDGDMPYSQEFGDHFYCREDGRLECGHVFLAGNGLPRRWERPGTFRIGELGFGTGLNFCETWRQWKETQTGGAHLHFVSFERFPMQAADIGRALSRWSEIDLERQTLTKSWPADPAGVVDCCFDRNVRLTVICGSAFDEIGRFAQAMDAWFLDGFAPRRNPDMWSDRLMRLIFCKTVDGGSFATYAAAGHVRRNLQAAGFTIERRSGFGNKREMLCGTKSLSLGPQP